MPIRVGTPISVKPTTIAGHVHFFYHDLVATTGVPDLPFAGGSYRPNNDGRLLRHGDEIKIPKEFACRVITGPNNNNKGRKSRQGDKFPKEVET